MRRRKIKQLENDLEIQKSLSKHIMYNRNAESARLNYELSKKDQQIEMLENALKLACDTLREQGIVVQETADVKSLEDFYKIKTQNK